MDFRTVIKIAPHRGEIRHSDRLMLIGSCFTDNIGARMRTAMMHADVNPLGTVYNPKSLHRIVDRIIDNRQVADDELFEAGGLWHHFDFHSEFSGTDRDSVKAGMNAAIASANAAIKSAQWVIITLGTAICYELADTGTVVNNCHKLPADRFVRRMASASEIAEILGNVADSIKAVNPQSRVMFTVSPIRHIGDGLDTNSLSKATLRVAIDAAVSLHPDFCSYFPSYEIMLDDLRDYRFYAADMVHPSEVAISYIWQLFAETYFDDKSLTAIDRCQRLSKRLAHRIMTDSPENLKFREGTRQMWEQLVNDYPYLNDFDQNFNI
jgi:hypothetical protein